MAATPDFSWAYDLVPRDDLEADRFNSAMSQLESYINSLKARLDLLDGAVTPTEYVTDTDLQNHVDATAPHKRMVRFSDASVITGDTIPANKIVQAQHFSGTVGSGGTVGITFSLPYTSGGLVGISLVPIGSHNALGISAPALNGVTVTGTAGTQFHGIAWGWY